MSVRRSSAVLRPATEDDRRFLRQLHHRCFRRWVEEVWGWDDAEQDRRFDAAWTTAGHFVVELNGTPIGALRTSQRHDHLFIDDIEIDPDHQGRGIGTRLLQRVLADAESSGTSVRLQVLRNNPAKRLYERLGFRVDGSNDTHYLMQRPPSRRGGSE